MNWKPRSFCKEVRFSKIYNGQIVEIQFTMLPKRGWFNENVTPMLEVLKALIPATAREFSTDTKKWRFSIAYWEPYKVILEKNSWSIREIEDKDTAIPHVEVPKEYAKSFHYENEVIVTKEDPKNIAKQLSTYLGVEITTQDLADLKKLYRRKALELHPDRNGGDGSKMSELNRLWTLYCDIGGVKQ